jgi:hypothetical protein
MILKEIQMGAPAQPRKKKRDKNLSKSRTEPQKNLFVRMQETEEGRALWKIWTDRRFLKPNGRGPGRPLGSIDGYSKTELTKQRKVAKEEAKGIVKYMEETKGFVVPKAEFAREAIVAAVETMRMEAISAKDKLAAARLVLDFTLAKPASQAEVTVKRAEDFLADIAVEMEQSKQIE